MTGRRTGNVSNMTNSMPDPPADDGSQTQDEQHEQPPEQTSPHEKAPPENPPIDDYDLERGRANLNRVIAK